jgi:hypothetical protein
MWALEKKLGKNEKNEWFYWTWQLKSYPSHFIMRYRLTKERKILIQKTGKSWRGNSTCVFKQRITINSSKIKVMQNGLSTNGMCACFSVLKSIIYKFLAQETSSIDSKLIQFSLNDDLVQYQHENIIKNS